MVCIPSSLGRTAIYTLAGHFSDNVVRYDAVSGQPIADGPVDRFRVTFDEVINLATFSATDISLVGPAGNILVEVTPLPNNTTFEVAFTPQTGPGSYSVSIGPNVENVSGQPMNQDGDAVSGEPTEDAYRFGFALKNAVPGVSVTSTGELVTGEDGNSAQFSVVLDSTPSANVFVSVASSDTTEGAVSASTLTFTPGNWHVPQTVDVVGVDDAEVDGDVGYNVTLGPTSSADARYVGIDVNGVSVTNLDNDVPPSASDLVLLSLRNNQTVDGTSVANEDILAFDGTGFEKRFDGSDVGLGSMRIDAFAFLGDTDILISFDKPGSLAGIGSVDDSDLVLFTAAQLGENTAGSFSLYFDGSDVGLSRNGEDVDGLDILPNGTLLISTNGSPRVPGINGRDEDILAFHPTSLGANTAGTWSMYFNGSDVGLASSSGEDVNAFAVAASGELHLSTVGDFGVSGPIGSDEDVFSFHPSSTGSSTSGSFDLALLFVGGDWGLSSNDIYGLDVRESVANASQSQSIVDVAFESLVNETALESTQNPRVFIRSYMNNERTT